MQKAALEGKPKRARHRAVADKLQRCQRQLDSKVPTTAKFEENLEKARVEKDEREQQVAAHRVELPKLRPPAVAEEAMEQGNALLEHVFVLGCQTGRRLIGS